MTEWSISHETKKTHRHKGCGWLALRGEAVSTKKPHRLKGCGWLAHRRGSKYKKIHIVAKDVVGLQVGDGKNDSLTKMKTY